ncbi:peptidoglycan-associated lipoprotein [Catenovulum agarivorans DS-2]|uniref:Peptidoglycan-associated lipoprotein n=1 Tax=Catenovulum agarivorans DS-2 TaxID=1328313 RepID=W7QN99_9ALTE|nr:OmpA family protein [Catenovulum agarivorans]EWH09378.1 peptidoglycan-associated lipoprotein [Catenovulum agarivorans DS-2]
MIKKHLAWSSSIATILISGCSSLNLPDSSETVAWQHISETGYKRLHDADKDGVIAARELCKGTLANREVSNYGCSEQEEKEHQRQSRIYFGYQEVDLNDVAKLALDEFLQGLDSNNTWAIKLNSEQAQNPYFIERTDKIVAYINNNYPQLYHELTLSQAGEVLKKVTDTGEVETPSEQAHILYFDHDSSVIPIAEQEKIAQFIRQYKANHGEVIYIGGHASQSGEDDYNLKLSQRRADAILHLLTRILELPKSKIKLTALGEKSPLVSPMSPQAENKNRRVELVYQYTQQQAANEDDTRIEITAQTLLTQAKLKWHIYIMEEAELETTPTSTQDHEALGW